jgi:hypothetical protein
MSGAVISSPSEFFIITSCDFAELRRIRVSFSPSYRAE